MTVMPEAVNPGMPSFLNAIGYLVYEVETGRVKRAAEAAVAAQARGDVREVRVHRGFADHCIEDDRRLWKAIRPVAVTANLITQSIYFGVLLRLYSIVECCIGSTWL